MTSDDYGTEQLGTGEPGLEQLLRTLTSPPTPGELAGEQAAVTMFRAHVHASPPDSASRPRAGFWPGRLGIPKLRVASIGAAALVAGFASAAYAAVLPPPVQHAAYVAFHWAGVPDAHHSKQTSSAGGSVTTPAAGHSSGVPSASHRNGGRKAGRPNGSPRPSSGRGSTSPAGPWTLTISVSGGAEIPAGTSATIDGRLTARGQPDAGVIVRLMERAAGHFLWVRVGRATTNARGDVTFTIPDLTTNARFRLAYAASARSPAVLVTVMPGLATNLTLGPKGIKDYLAVSATFARRGDAVLLQVLENGSWVTLQQHRLNAQGASVFAFSATRWQNDEIQAVLEATNRHAAATSTPITVPAPA